MSNTEPRPPVVDAGEEPAAPPVAIVDPKLVPLGEGMDVRRTLPTRGRTLVGGWCFFDHYGPESVATTGGMDVAWHPHTCLQTVSWLFAGEIDHRDSVGTEAVVRPGELNLMTAGRGIAHSEYTAAGTTRLHGVQLWVALPRAHRFVEPHFDHYVPPRASVDGTSVSVFLGELEAGRSPVETYSPLVGAELGREAPGTTRLRLKRGFEHGLLVDAGDVVLRAGSVERRVAPGQLAVVEPGVEELEIESRAGRARMILIGGEPFGEDILMWWNFVGREHDEIEAYRDEWQALIAGREGRFGAPVDVATIPAPPLPGSRLKPRGNLRRS